MAKEKTNHKKFRWQELDKKGAKYRDFVRKKRNLNISLEYVFSESSGPEVEGIRAASVGY
jgi:hypothetical protein